MANQALCGILNINKPSGMTSHDVVLHVRRITGQKKVGHAGTLDPMATGVLLLCLGQATRVAEYLQASDKVYLARIRLGIATDTYDAEGQITSQTEITVARAQIEQELQRFVGTLEQVPPLYSAIKRAGTPLYRLARRGQGATPAARTVQIQALTLCEWTPPELQIEVRCSKGTYIRSLAHELGQRLGCGAHLVRLTRTASGRFRLQQALPLEELEQAFARGKGHCLLLPLDAALQDLPAVALEPATTHKIVLGQRVQLPEAPTGDMCRAYTLDGRLLALLRRDASDHTLWQPHKVFQSLVERANNENHR